MDANPWLRSVVRRVATAVRSTSHGESTAGIATRSLRGRRRRSTLRGKVRACGEGARTLRTGGRVACAQRASWHLVRADEAGRSTARGRDELHSTHPPVKCAENRPHVPRDHTMSTHTVSPGGRRDTLHCSADAGTDIASANAVPQDGGGVFGGAGNRCTLAVWAEDCVGRPRAAARRVAIRKSAFPRPAQTSRGIRDRAAAAARLTWLQTVASVASSTRRRLGPVAQPLLIDGTTSPRRRDHAAHMSCPRRGRHCLARCGASSRAGSSW